MRIVHVVPGIAEEASGPSYSVPKLAASIAELGDDVALHTLFAPATMIDGITVKTYPSWQLFRRLGVSSAMRIGLANEAQQVDIIHNHSLWMMPNVYPAWAVRGTKCRLMVSPRGTLSAWAQKRSRWLKRAFWAACQGNAVQTADCLHATSHAELADIRRRGLKAPVVVLPNGIDMPPAIGPRRKTERMQLLFLGRIHPVKGMDDLLRAWRQIQSSFPCWDLQIAGPDNDGWKAKMEQLSNALGNERVSFIGPRYGLDKWQAYRDADLYILPSHSENFGMTVAESLASSTPVIVTRGAPWSEVETRQCGWWPANGVPSLVEVLNQALSCPRVELETMGLRGANWMRSEFSWSQIAIEMRDTYRWLLGGGAPPSCVDRITTSTGNGRRAA